MTHPEELLAEYVDGSLSDQDRAVVEAHLESCQRCRDEVGLSRGAVSAIRSLPEVPAPSDLGHSIEQARAESPIGAGPTAPAGASFAARRYRFLAVAAAAAVVAAIFILPRISSSDQPAPAAAGATSEGTKDAAFGGLGSNARSLPLEIQQIDYSPTSAGMLAKTAADQNPVAAPPPTYGGETQSAGSAEALTALSCLRDAFKGFSGEPIRVIQAKFQGSAAYIGVYTEGPGGGSAPNTVSVRVAAVNGCSLLSFTSKRI
jgi:hypothetical protein